jgi:hypothetical protein
MAVTFADLLAAWEESPQTETDFLNLMLGYLGTGDYPFPVTSWQEGSVPKQLLEADARSLASWLQNMYGVVQGGIFELSEGTWTDYWAQSQYNEERTPAIATQGTVTLVNAGVLPWTLAVGEFTLGGSAITPTYTNTAEFTLGAGSSEPVYLQATVAGAAANVAGTSLNTILDPSAMPGVTITTSGGPLDWITRLGIDQESDNALKIRCRAKWPSLSTLQAKTVDAWDYAIRTFADTTVSQTKVLENTPAGGEVTIYILGGTPATVDEWLNGPLGDGVGGHRPLCSQCHVNAAVVETVALAGTIYIPTSYQTAAQAALATALTAFSADFPFSQKVYYSQILGILQGLEGVDHCEGITIGGASADFDLAFSWSVPSMTTTGLIWAVP